MDGIHLPRQGSLFQELTGFACFILLSTLELLHWGQSALGRGPTDYSSSQERLGRFCFYRNGEFIPSQRLAFH